MIQEGSLSELVTVNVDAVGDGGLGVELGAVGLLDELVAELDVAVGLDVVVGLDVGFDVAVGFDVGFDVAVGFDVVVEPVDVEL